MYPPLGEGDAGLSDPIAPMYGGGMCIGGLKIPKHAPSKEDAGLNDPIDLKHWKGGTPNPNAPPREGDKGLGDPTVPSMGGYMYGRAPKPKTPSQGRGCRAQ